MLSLTPAAKGARKEMRAIRKAKNELEKARDAGGLDAPGYRVEYAALKEREDAVIAAFNAEWVASRKAVGQ